jgi:hypothetical protein
MHERDSIRMAETRKTQLEKFKQAARQLETDDDEDRFDERLRRLVTRTPEDRPRSGD